MKALFVILLVLLSPFLIIGWFYFRAPVYTFAPAKPFSGKHFYNPYANLDSAHWQRANFHMHANAWGGLTNGRKNTDTAIIKTYSQLGFNSMAISNYMNINALYSDSASYIPCYEHGYGIFKNHHLCLGAKRVDWFDIPLWQTLSEKQYMMERLSQSTELLSVNHPSFFNGYKPSDFSKLSGYHFIEVLNGFRTSIAHWDSALSAGRPALILADDDMHDITNPLEPGRRFTLINALNNSRNEIFAALKAGKAIGVYMPTPVGFTWEMKKEQLAQLPVLKSVTINNDTLKVQVNNPAKSILFWGQNGKKLAEISESAHAAYALQPADTYVRTQIIFHSNYDKEGVWYLLNPIIRSENGNLPAMPLATINKTATVLLRTITVLLLLLVIRLLYFIRQKRGHRRKRRLNFGSPL